MQKQCCEKLISCISAETLQGTKQTVKKKADKETYDVSLCSGDLQDQDNPEIATKEDDEYLPAYKITRSNSRKNRLDLNSYSDVNAHDKKKKQVPDLKVAVGHVGSDIKRAPKKDLLVVNV